MVGLPISKEKNETLEFIGSQCHQYHLTRGISIYWTNPKINVVDKIMCWEIVLFILYHLPFRLLIELIKFMFSQLPGNLREWTICEAPQSMQREVQMRSRKSAQQNVKIIQDRTPERMSDMMSEYMPDRMSEFMPDRMSDRMSVYTCHTCFQKICQNLCQNKGKIVLMKFQLQSVCIPQVPSEATSKKIP